MQDNLDSYNCHKRVTKITLDCDRIWHNPVWVIIFAKKQIMPVV